MSKFMIQKPHSKSRLLATAALLLAIAPVQSQTQNGSFESFDAGSGSGNPATYQYPNVTNWNYSGSPTTPGLLGAISETIGAIPGTPHGSNWLLVDSRINTQKVYQSLGVMTSGHQLSISALIGRQTGAAVADFELALYRSNSQSGTPDTLLASIGRSDVSGLAAGATTTVSKNYTTVAADNGEKLFVQIRLLSGDGSSVEQALIDNVVVTPDVFLPGVALLSPADDAAVAPVAANLVATFTETVVAGTGFITLKRTDDDSAVETFNVASSPQIIFSGSQLTIDPTADLEGETSYYVEIDATAIKDSSDNLFAGLDGNDAWNFTTIGDGGTIASGSGSLSLDIDAAGVIRGVTLGGSGGPSAFQRTSLGQSIFAGTTSGSVTKETLSNGLSFTRVIQKGGSQATVTETFTPGLDADSISWDITIESADAAWTTPIQSLLQISPVGGDLKFWAPWMRAGLPLTNGYRDPLAPMNFSNLHLPYGGGSNPANVSHGISVPLAVWLNDAEDVGLSLLQSPMDFSQDMTLHTSPVGAVNFERTKLRIGGGNTIRLHMQLVSHPADWRAGLGFMTKHYPEAFDPPNPEAHNVGGGGTYANYQGEDISPADVQKYKDMGFTMNWSAAFPWPYIGMSLPPVDTDTEEWDSIGGANGIVSRKVSIQDLNNHAQKFRGYGFHHLEYFTVTEAGNFVSPTPTARVAVSDEDLWKLANDYVYHQIPNANMGVKSWLDSYVMDSGDPDWQASILSQTQDISSKLTACSGVVIDRLDHLARFHSGSGIDDGVTWDGSPKRSLIYSWHDTMDKMIPITKAANKVVFINSHIMRRVDVLRHSDGFYSEQRGTGIHNLLAFAGAKKPVVIWDSPSNDTEFQESLYLGMYPTVPFPKADHTTLPNAALEAEFLKYGAMYNAMRGKKWVLQPHVLKVTNGNVLANVFEVKSGFVVPVMFGGSATTATIELKDLPIATLTEVKILQPGVATPLVVTPAQNGNTMTIDVPLVLGCAMVQIIADKSTASNTVPVPALHNVEGSNSLQWEGNEAHTYFIQTSTDLVNWTYLPIIKSGADTTLNYTLGENSEPRFFTRLKFHSGTDVANPYTADFDGDGVSNWEEIRPGGSGTDPFVHN
mgnify:CR=1 FL=1